jgi:uncharacterized membrane protein YdjX (TVP38/TMEM64 family)
MLKARPLKKGALMIDKSTPPPKPSTLMRLSLLVLICMTLTLAFALRGHLNFETLRDNREALIAFRDADYALSAALFVAAYVGIVAFSLPGATPATLAGGFLFGTAFGTLFNVLGAGLGAVVLFIAIKAGFGRQLSERLDTSSGRVKRVKDRIDENQWSMLFLIRLVPIMPFFLANLLPALIGVPLYRFVISTFLGILPGALVFTSVGAGLGDVFASGEAPNLKIIFAPQILWPIIGLCILAVLPMFLKGIMGRKDLL